jgi:trehalose synthase
MATIIAAALGYTDITSPTADQIDKIKQTHLLLAMFNALQPGVFALSGWDLCGMLTLPRQSVPALLSSGDVRWLNRAAYDLMDYRPDATESPSKIPRGTSLYGSLPQQLQDAGSFACRLADILKIRAHYRIAASVQLDVPPVDDKAVLVMVHRLDTGRIQATVLNFADRTVTGRVSSEHLPAGAAVTDMLTGKRITRTDENHACTLSLQPHQGMSLLLGSPQSR